MNAYYVSQNCSPSTDELLAAYLNCTYQELYMNSSSVKREQILNGGLLESSLKKRTPLSGLAACLD